jgi:hypothetical protein
MGKASRTKQDGDRRARIAAQREAERRAQQLRRIYLAGGSILVVAIVVVALVLVKLNSGSGTTSNGNDGPAGSALARLTSQIENVPGSVTNSVAGGGVNTKVFISAPTAASLSSAASNVGSYMATVSGPPLTSGGKPEILYLGGEYCPFCAAERWAMVNALSRFGTFTGLKTTHSSSTDVYPNSPTYTFYGSAYTSRYITFTPVEEYTNYRVGHTSNRNAAYQTLQTPTSAQAAVASQYNPGSSIPFLDFGNKYVEVGNLAPLGPQLLSGKTWQQVGAAMANPTSALGKAEIGNANYITAAICKLTSNQPASACTPAIAQLEKNLAS